MRLSNLLNANLCRIPISIVLKIRIFRRLFVFQFLIAYCMHSSCQGLHHILPTRGTSKVSTTSLTFMYYPFFCSLIRNKKTMVVDFRIITDGSYLVCSLQYISCIHLSIHVLLGKHSSHRLIHSNTSFTSKLSTILFDLDSTCKLVLFCLPI